MKEKKERIFLIGFMASGKSTIGKELAKELNYDFIDTDRFIEKEIGMTIPIIFEKFGEDFFRKKESEILISIVTKKNVVISVGGGLPCHNNNMSLLKKTGKVIFLKSGFEVYYERLQQMKDRPIANKLSPNELKKLYTSRLPIYTQADFTILSNRLIPLVVKRIIHLIFKK